MPLIVGADVFDGGVVDELGGGGEELDAAVTTAVAAEVAAAEPFLFDAITTTRIVAPTSAAASVYAEEVAPLIALQFAPLESQRCHAYVYFNPTPLQVPVVAVTVLPCCVVPEIDGGAVFVGGCCPCGGVAGPADALPVISSALTSTAEPIGAMWRRLIALFSSGVALDAFYPSYEGTSARA